VNLSRSGSSRSLRTHSAVSECVHLIRQRSGHHIRPYQLPPDDLLTAGRETNDPLVPGGERREQRGLIEREEVGDGAVPAAAGTGCRTRCGWIRRRLSPQRARAVRDS
jgi:hypothetical protein